MKTKRRIRRSDAEWNEVFTQFDASGLSATAFCRQRRIPYGSFMGRRRRTARGEWTTASRSPAIATDWLPVDFAGGEAPAKEATSPWDMELELPGGVRLRMRTRA